MRKLLSSILLALLLSSSSWAALTDNLISYWAGNEASGNLPDKVVATANTMTDTNTVTSATGLVYSLSRQYTAATSEYHTIADNASLSLGGGTSFTYVAWVYLDTLNTDRVILCKDDNGTNRELLLYVTSANQPRVITWTGASGAGAVTISYNATAMTAATWYMVSVTNDQTNTKIYLNTANNQLETGGVAAGWNGGAAFQIGNRSASALPWNGRIGPTIFWKRALSAAEITQVYNSGAGMTYEAMVAPVPLNTNLISYWAIDEANGTRADKVTATANTLTDNNTVTQALGKVYANAGQFTAANSEYLSRADNASLSVGGTAFTFIAWVYADTFSSFNAIIDKESTDAEYTLLYNGSSSRFVFITYTGSGTGSVSATANSLGAPSTATWYMIAVTSDQTTNKISANAGTQDSVSAVNAGWNGTNPFSIGGVGGAYWNGRIGPVMFWKRALSAAEITTVYNNGAGLTYEGILGTGIIMHPLVTFNSTTNATSYTFPSTTIHANRLAILSVQHARDAGLLGTPVSTMTGVTWNPFTPNDYIQYHTTGTPTRKLSGWWAYPTSDQTGVITVDFSGNTQDGAAGSLTEFEGAQSVVQTTVASGGSASVQVTCTLAAFTDSVNNVSFGAFGTSQAAGITPGSSFIEIHDVTYATPSNELQTEWRVGQDTTVDATFGAADCGCLAAELSSAASVTGTNTWFTSQQRRRK